MAVQIPSAAALRDEPAAWLQGTEQAAEQTWMIEHPVEGRGAEDRVGAFVDGQGGAVGMDEAGAILLAGRQLTASRRQHVRRDVEADGAAVRQAIEQQGRQAARTAPHVQYELVAT